MIGNIRLVAAGLAASGALAAAPAVALAQGPVITGGLVNVTIANVANNNQVTVTVPVQAAANICGVSVAVLATLLPGPTACTSNPSQGTTISVSTP
jgi:hypothetical protein